MEYVPAVRTIILIILARFANLSSSLKSKPREYYQMYSNQITGSGKKQLPCPSHHHTIQNQPQELYVEMMVISAALHEERRRVRHAVSYKQKYMYDTFT